MAKRVPIAEKPYRPLQASLVRAVADRSQVRSEPASAVPASVPAPQLAAVQSIIEAEHSSTDLTTSSDRSLVSRQRREKRVLLTPDEERRFESLVARLAQALDTPLKSSHVLRAAIAVLLRADDDLVRESRSIAPLTRPPNGSAHAIAAFERSIADIITRSVRSGRFT